MTNNSATQLVRRTYCATNGLRDPDWRWRLAMDCLPVTPRTRRPDPICWHLVDYLEYGDEWISALQGTRRFSIRPVLAIRNHRILRLRLEARILAYRDIGLAAKACHVSAQVAHDYCSIFFDVGDRLHATRAIDSKVVHAASETDDFVRRELYWHSYFGGPLVAEHWLTQLPFIGVSADHDLDTPEGMRRERLELTIASREPSPEFYDRKLWSVYQRLLDQERPSRSYAECVEDHVTDVLVTHWLHAPTEVASEIVSTRAAA